MKRIKLTVAYDGTAYCGFQLQPEQPTVEGELNRAIYVLTGEPVTVIGASRTDSGVHAKGNVAVFDTASTIPGDRFFAALNTKLPGDIRILRSEEVPSEWHPRKTDCVKTYEYRVDLSYVPDPMKRRYSMHWPRKVCVDTMREAAAVLVGEHDFTTFANPSSQVLKEGGSAVRTLYEVSIIPAYRTAESVDTVDTQTAAGTVLTGRTAGSGRGTVPQAGAETPVSLVIRVRGNGFLYNMVRIIAGTLLDVGTGRFTPEDIKTMLEAKDRTRAGLTAEPQGLTLVSIDYAGPA